MKTLLKLRRFLVPDEIGYGWLPFVLLIFLLPFIFGPVAPLMVEAPMQELEASSASEPMPDTAPQAEAIIQINAVPTDNDANAEEELPVGQLEQWAYNGRLSFLAIIPFLVLYFIGFRKSGLSQLVCAWGIGSIGYWLRRYDPLAIIYVGYATTFIGLCALPMYVRLSALGLLLCIGIGQAVGEQGGGAFYDPQLWEFFSWRYHISSVDFLLPIIVFLIANFYAIAMRKGRDLNLSQAEAKRLAAFAERERIARDLHDLLGHSLSLIALKAELAGKLLGQDTDSARKEIADVRDVSRHVLDEVRSAVSGMRKSGIDAELASAKLLLDSTGVNLQIRRTAVAWTESIEATLALVLREAITNVQRHANARNVFVEVYEAAEQAVLEVRDDGHCMQLKPGNGLKGMRERLRAMGGWLTLDGNGGGTHLVARIPLYRVKASEDEDDHTGNNR